MKNLDEAIDIIQKLQILEKLVTVKFLFLMLNKQYELEQKKKTKKLFN